MICFYNHESCGQCTPCREGFNWIRILLVGLIQGKAEQDAIDSIHRIASNIIGNTLCALGDAGAMPVCSYIDKFRPEFEAYLNKKVISAWFLNWLQIDATKNINNSTIFYRDTLKNSGELQRIKLQETYGFMKQVF